MTVPSASVGRSHRITSRTSRDPARVVALRDARRRILLREIIAGVSHERVTHEWLALQSGIPLPYLRWRYPTIEDLVRTLDESWV
ncbi:MAG: hypothetical protein QM572_14905 [Nocardioides sp.]|uniref:hypothetical protein n=1 Tax=Nocardioides sp. TaxID=35761 RepID=UPI0039E68E04